MDFQEVTRQKLESEGQPLVVHKQIYNPLLVMVIVHILFSICSKQTKGFNYLSKVGDKQIIINKTKESVPYLVLSENRVPQNPLVNHDVPLSYMTIFRHTHI
jgi:hypothetical protein